MKKFSMKNEMLIVIMIIVAMLTISTAVFATGTADKPFDIQGIISAPGTVNEEQTPVVPEQTPVIPEQTPAPSGNTTGSNYQNTALPQTGDASDYAIFGLIVVAVVIAVYAYRKVRDYNI